MFRVRATAVHALIVGSRRVLVVLTNANAKPSHGTANRTRKADSSNPLPERTGVQVVEEAHGFTSNAEPMRAVSVRISAMIRVALDTRAK